MPRYTPDRLVVAAAGSLDHDQVVELTAAAFGSVLTGTVSPAAPRLGATSAGAASGTGVRLVSRPVEQANLVLGCAGLARTDEPRFALGVLNAALGGGMSSRLFQEVREKRGLAYSVYSFSSQHADCGQWGIYAGCLPAKTEEVLAICQEEIAKVIESGLTDEELDRGKGQLRGSIVLGLEDPSSRMSRLGKSELVYPRLEPVEEILARDRGRHARPGARGRGCRARPAEGAGDRRPVRRRRGVHARWLADARPAASASRRCARRAAGLARYVVASLPCHQVIRRARCIGSGRAADVYAIGADRVLRRYRTPFDVQPEADIMRHLHGAGFPVPNGLRRRGHPIWSWSVSTAATCWSTSAAGPGWRDGTPARSRRCTTGCTRFRLRRAGRSRSGRVTGCCTSTCTRATSC